MSYYYLIASLPDLSLDDSLKYVDFDETFDTIRRNLEADDLELFNYLIYPNDNRNLLNYLFYEYKDLPTSKPLWPYTIPIDSIQSFRRDRSLFPDYMVEFFQESEAQFTSWTMREMENRLQIKFEEELEKSELPFVTAYFRFKHSLAEIVASLNQAHYRFLFESQFSHANSSLNMLKKGQSPSSSVLKEYPYAEQLRETVALGDPIELERFVERVEWDYLEGPHTTFGTDHVLAYAARLLLLSRRKRQDREVGTERYKVLKNDIRNKVHSPKTPVV